MSYRQSFCLLKSILFNYGLKGCQLLTKYTPYKLKKQVKTLYCAFITLKDGIFRYGLRSVKKPIKRKILSSVVVQDYFTLGIIPIGY